MINPLHFLRDRKKPTAHAPFIPRKEDLDWIVFNRLPDRIPPKDDGYHGTDSDETVAYSDTDKDENEEAKVTEPISNQERMGTDQQPEE